MLQEEGKIQAQHFNVRVTLDYKMQELDQLVYHAKRGNFKMKMQVALRQNVYTNAVLVQMVKLHQR